MCVWGGEGTRVRQQRMGAGRLEVVWAVGKSTYEVLVNADGSVNASDEWCAGSGASSHTSTRSCAPIAGRIASGDDGKGATLGRV